METRAALWTMIAMFVIFKVGTTIAIAFYAAPTGIEASIRLFIAFHWPFILAGLIFGVAPLAYWARLVRMRRRRAALIAAEWRVDQPSRT